MTEYDFSPEAYERHLATQARIARWVDDTSSQSPENPFSALPGDYESVASSAHSPHPHPQDHAALPARYANTNALPLSPSYSYHSFDSAKRHKSKHSRHNTHRSRSLQPSPQFGQVMLPIAEGMYTTATQAQLARQRSPPGMPVRSPVRSSSTPIMGMSYHLPQTSQPSQSQQYVIQPSHYPHARTRTMDTQPSIDPHQMKLRSIPQAQLPAYFHNHHHASPSNSSGSQPRSASSNRPFFRDPASPAWTYSSLNASSVQSLLVSPTPSVPGVTFVQPNPHQPIVVPIQGGNGGYVVVPAAGQQVQVFVSLFSRRFELRCLLFLSSHPHLLRVISK